jgi:hypothetical protein
MWGKPRDNLLAHIGPRSHRETQGLVCVSLGYPCSGVPNAHQWTPLSHLEAYAPVLCGSLVERRRSELADTGLRRLDAPPVVHRDSLAAFVAPELGRGAWRPKTHQRAFLSH